MRTGDVAAASSLHEALRATPPAGRVALLTARLHTLEGNASDAARDLLVELSESRIEGVSLAATAQLASVLDPSVLVRTLRTLSATRVFAARHVCEQLRWRDALPLLADLRDGRLAPGIHLSFGEDLLALAAVFATGNEHDDRDRLHDVHRRRGEETVLLLGAARDPRSFLREVRAVNVMTWPLPNDDVDLAAWAFANPALQGEAREHCVEQNTPRVIAALRASGVLGLHEVYRWINPLEGHRKDRILSVLNLPHEVQGAASLRRAALSSCRNVAEVCGDLSVAERRNLAEELADQNTSLAEVVAALLGEWQGNVKSLLYTARTLLDDSTMAPQTTTQSPGTWKRRGTFPESVERSDP